MAAAGYDPRAALDLWELMSCVEADALAAGQTVSMENRFALLRTHPTSVARQAALSKEMDKALEVWKEYSRKRMERPSAPQGIADEKAVTPVTHTESGNPSLTSA